jgi:hypothetical protein
VQALQYKTGSLVSFKLERVSLSFRCGVYFAWNDELTKHESSKRFLILQEPMY